MEKPWDCIRTRPQNQPIGHGTWRTPALATIEVKSVGKREAVIHIDSFCFGAESLRLLSEFCLELADQLEGK